MLNKFAKILLKNGFPVLKIYTYKNFLYTKYRLLLEYKYNHFNYTSTH